MCYMPCTSQIFKMGIFIFRFDHTIAAIFNGHTHNDHFHVYYAAEDPNQPISVAINGGSVTPFTHLNSNYKTYTINSTTYVSTSDEDRIETFILWSSGL
jgi:sphingomyelin phosphodiesterase